MNKAQFGVIVSNVPAHLLQEPLINSHPLSQYEHAGPDNRVRVKVRVRVRISQYEHAGPEAPSEPNTNTNPDPNPNCLWPPQSTHDSN